MNKFDLLALFEAENGVAFPKAYKEILGSFESWSPKNEGSKFLRHFKAL